MKTLLTLALFLVSLTAHANCVSNTIIVDNKIVICTTCCTGNYCTTTCI